MLVVSLVKWFLGQRHAGIKEQNASGNGNEKSGDGLVGPKSANGPVRKSHNSQRSDLDPQSGPPLSLIVRPADSRQEIILVWPRSPFSAVSDHIYNARPRGSTTRPPKCFLNGNKKQEPIFH